MDDATGDLPKPSMPAFDGGADAALSPSEVLVWLYEAFFLPGDWLLWVAASYWPGAAAMLDLDTGDYGGKLSGFLSAAVWLLLVIGAAIVYQWLLDTDRALTRGSVAAYRDLKRRSRIAAALLAAALRRRKVKAAQRPVDVPSDLPLSRAELHTLQLHALLEAGYALGVSEVASALGVRKVDAERVLERLCKLGLIATTVGGLEGESAHTLTSTGRAFLILRQSAPKQHAPAAEANAEPQP